MTDHERITALEARLAKAEARIAELEGRMPLGPIGPLYAKPNDPGWIWPDPPPDWWAPDTITKCEAPPTDAISLPREADLPRWPDRAGGPSKDNGERSGSSSGVPHYRHESTVGAENPATAISGRWLGTV